MEDEDGTSYYYRGNVDNNYVQFGEYTDDYYVYRYNSYGSDYDFVTLDSCKYYNGSCNETNRVLKYSAGTPMYWRIVRVNGDGSLRLIYNGTSTNATGQDLMIGVGAYNFDDSDPKYTGYTYDRNTNEIDSNVKKDIDTWYKNALLETVYDNKITGGRFCSDSSGYKTASEYGNQNWNSSYNLYASNDRLDQADVIQTYAKPNAPTLKCPSTSESYGGSYRLKAGLITADELVLAGSLPYIGTYDDSYLSNDWNFWWSMTPAVYNGNSSLTWEMMDNFNPYNGTSSANDGLRPVINVMPDNGFASGDGTAENPYIIE